MVARAGRRLLRDFCLTVRDAKQVLLSLCHCLNHIGVKLRLLTAAEQLVQVVLELEEEEQ